MVDLNSFQNMNQHQEQIKTVRAVMYKRCSIVLLCLMILLISVIVIYFSTSRSVSSNDDDDQSLLNEFQQIFNRSHSQTVPSSPQMKQFMRSIYGQSLESDQSTKRRKRHINSFIPSRVLSDDMEMIISLPSLVNQSNPNDFYFDYDGSLELLAHAELIIPLKNLLQTSTIRLILHNGNFSITLNQPMREKWIKINITQYLTHFPQEYSIQVDGEKTSSLAFLTLYFNRNVYSRTRRDLSLSSSSLSDTTSSVSSSTDCQVRPYRLIFSQLNWTSWIVEPTSYEMNLCSGSCTKRSRETIAYLTMQTLIHHLWPKTIAAPCCQPSKFSSTILLYYDGPNLILKRFENMRVLQCNCS